MLRSIARVLFVTIFVIAVAVMLIRQPTITKIGYLLHSRASAGRIRADVNYLTTAATPRSGEHLAVAVAYIESALRQTGASVVRQPCGRACTNLIATFGPDSAAPPLVVGAHYDAFTGTGPLPGADDNASSTAGLLELARLLARERLQRQVTLVAFANEEPPFFGSERMGSAVHAASVARPGEMLCLEMIGYYSPHQRWDASILAAIYGSRGDFIGVTGGWTDRALARRVKRAIAGAGGIRVVSFTGPREMLDASDQRNYWSRGWRAVMITDTAYERNANYHTMRDTAATLDYARIAAVVNGVANGVMNRRADERSARTSAAKPYADAVRTNVAGRARINAVAPSPRFPSAADRGRS